MVSTPSCSGASGEVVDPAAWRGRRRAGARPDTVRSPAGRDAHRLHAVDDRVEADVGREVEPAARLHEVDVALALGDGAAALLPGRLVEVGHVARAAHRRVEHEHLRGHVVALGAEDVVDAAVAGGADAVVGVVGVGEAGVVHARHQSDGRAVVRRAGPEAHRDRGDARRDAMRTAASGLDEPRRVGLHLARRLGDLVHVAPRCPAAWSGRATPLPRTADRSAGTGSSRASRRTRARRRSAGSRGW